MDGQNDAPAVAPPSIPTKAPGELMVGDKPVSAVKAETDAAIAEVMAELGDDDGEEAPPPVDPTKAREAAKARASGKTKGKQEAKQDDEESDYEAGEDDADGDAADGESDDSDDAGDASEDDEASEDDDEKAPRSIAEARRELKRESKRAREELEVTKAQLAQYEQNLRQYEQTLLRAKQEIEQHRTELGDLGQHLEPARRGDPEALGKLAQGLAEKVGIQPQDFIRAMAGALSPEAIRMQRLEKEIRERREAEQRQQQQQQQEQQRAEAVNMVSATLKRVKHKLARHPEAGKLVLEYASQNYVPATDKGIAAAASEVLRQLRAQHQMLGSILGRAAPEPDDAGDDSEQPARPAKSAKRSGGVRRELAAEGTTRIAEPMTTGDAILEALQESGLRPSSKDGWRGKKIGHW